MQRSATFVVFHFWQDFGKEDEQTYLLKLERARMSDLANEKLV